MEKTKFGCAPWLRDDHKRIKMLEGRVAELRETFEGHGREEEDEVLAHGESLFGESGSKELLERMVECREQVMRGEETLQAPRGGEQKRTAPQEHSEGQGDGRRRTA
jgi:hypothetical protein